MPLRANGLSVKRQRRSYVGLLFLRYTSGPPYGTAESVFDLHSVCTTRNRMGDWALV